MSKLADWFMRLRYWRPGARNCVHLAQIRPVTPSAAGCVDCLKLGETWRWCYVDQAMV